MSFFSKMLKNSYNDNIENLGKFVIGLIIAAIVAVIVNIILSFIVRKKAIEKGRSGFLWFLLSIGSVAWFWLVVINKLEERDIYDDSYENLLRSDRSLAANLLGGALMEAVLIVSMLVFNRDLIGSVQGGMGALLVAFVVMAPITLIILEIEQRAFIKKPHPHLNRLFWVAIFGFQALFMYVYSGLGAEFDEIIPQSFLAIGYPLFAFTFLYSCFLYFFGPYKFPRIRRVFYIVGFVFVSLVEVFSGIIDIEYMTFLPMTLKVITYIMAGVTAFAALLFIFFWLRSYIKSVGRASLFVVGLSLFGGFVLFAGAVGVAQMGGQILDEFTGDVAANNYLESNSHKYGDHYSDGRDFVFENRSDAEAFAKDFEKKHGKGSRNGINIKYRRDR